jgi:hypothetical protein
MDNNTIIVVWFCDKCEKLQTVVGADPKKIKCECGGGKLDGYAVFVGRGPVDPMACRNCRTHWPADKKRCPGCKAKG